jgi:hypothetical protein
MVRKMLPLKSKWKCDENFPKKIWPKKEISPKKGNKKQNIF